MPDTLNVEPARYAGPTLRAAEQRSIESFQQANGIGLTGTVQAAFSTTLPAVGVRFAARLPSDNDPDWELNDAKLRELTDGIDRDLWSLFADARSEEHATQIRAQLAYVMENRRTLGASGGLGIAASIGASALDPVYLAAGVATGGVGYSSKVGQLTNMLRAGLVTGTTFGAIESARAWLEPGTGAREIAQAAGGGLVLGGLGPPLAQSGRLARAGITGTAAGLTSIGVDAAISGVTGSEPDSLWVAAGQQFALTGLLAALPGRQPSPTMAATARDMNTAGTNAVKDAMFRTAQEQGETLTPKGEAFFKDQIDPSARIENAFSTSVDDLIDDVAWVAGADEAPEPRRATPAGLGAASPSTIAQPTVERPVKIPGDFDFADVKPAPPSLVNVGGIPISWGMSERLAAAPDNTLNLAARIFGSDPLPAADGSPAVYSAPEKAKDLTQSHDAVLVQRFDDLYGQHVAARRGSGLEPLTAEQWRIEVTRATRRGPGLYDTQGDATIHAAADFLRSGVFEWGRTFAERHGVPDFDAFPNDRTYVPRLFNRDALEEYALRYGQNDLMQRLQSSILRGDELRAAQETQTGQTLVPVLRITVDDALSMADAQIRNANTDGQSPQARASRRIPMDETFEWETPDGVRHSVEDLLHNDAAQIAQLYHRHIIGASAAQAGFQRISDFLRTAGEVEGPVITSREELLATLRARHSEGRLLGISMSPEEIERALRVLDALVRNVEGTPIHENTMAVRVSRMIGQITFIKNLSNIATGVLNLSEMPGSFAELGWRATVNQLPSVRQFVEIVRTGRATDELARDIQTMGIGVERVTRRVYRGINADEDAVGQRIGRAEYYVARAARIAGDVSGQSYGQDWMRLSVGKAVSQRWLDAALGGQQLSDGRLAAMGIDTTSGVYGRILEHMRQNATSENGLLGQRLISPHTEQWNRPDGTLDVEAIAAYRGAVARATRQAILTPDVSNYALWMTHPAARLMLQFRLFAWSAWRGKFLTAIHHRDRAAVSGVIVSTAAAAVFYAAATYIRSLGRTDADEYRDQMLTTDKIAKAAFGRASWSSLIPAMVDTAAVDVLRREPVFAHARASGLGGGLISGNPSLDWIKSAMGSVGALQAPLFDDYTFSKRDLENIRKGLFIPNLYGVQQIFQRLGEDLPEQSR